MTQEQQNILFGKFRTVECLKKDDTGSVWLAHHIYLDQPVILKTLMVSNLADPASAERFKREAKLLARLSHPNIIRVLDFSVDADCFYISFEFFPGSSLRARLKENKFSLVERCGILRQVAAALAAAHAQLIIHRDVKPENILIDGQGRVKLADFGLALLQEGAAVTRKSAVVGTPGYMSPEQIQGEALTPASDLFSLGIVAHELFFGRHPFIDADVGQTLNNILADMEVELPRDPALPEALRELTSGLLRKNRRQRIGSALEVVRRIQAVFPGETVAEAGGDAPAVGAKKASREAAGEAAAPAVPRPRRKRAPLVGGMLALAMTIVVLMLKYPGPVQQAGSPPAGGADTSAAILASAPGEAGRQAGEVQTSANKQEAESFGEPAPTTAANEHPHEPGGEAASGLAAPGGIGIGERPAAPSGGMPGGLYVTCEPWAEVFIDSVRIDATPLQDTLRLFPGAHELILKHPDYPPYRQILRIEPRQALRVAVNLDTLFGYLDLRIYPWAEVWLDGVQRGQTPIGRPLALEAGRHLLLLRHPQYGDVQDYIKVVKTETTRFTMNLSQLAGKRN